MNWKVLSAFVLALSPWVLVAQELLLRCRENPDGTLTCRVENPRPEPTSTPRPEPTSTPRPEPTATPTPSPRPTPTTSPSPTPPPPVSGMVGYGSKSVGGTGGTVTTFSGTITGQLFLSKMFATGPRILKFEPGVYDIELPCVAQGVGIMKEPFLTLDGTGAKVTLKKKCIESDYMFGSTHDVIVKNIIFDGNWNLGSLARDGGPIAGKMNMGNFGFDGDAKALNNGPFGNRNFYLEKVQWKNGGDSSPDLWCGNTDFTFIDVLIGPDNFHPQTISCDTFAAKDTVKARQRISFIRTAYFKHGDRGPKIKNGAYELEFINTIHSNWENLGGQIGKGDDGQGIHFETGATSLNIKSSAFLPGAWRRTYGCYVGDKPDSGNEYDTIVYLYMNDIFVPAGVFLECRTSKRNGFPVTPVPVPAWALVTPVPVNQLHLLVPGIGPSYQGQNLNPSFVSWVLAALNPVITGERNVIWKFPASSLIRESSTRQ